MAEPGRTEKGAVPLAGEKAFGYDASLFKTENPTGIASLCTEQPSGKVCPGRYRSISAIFTKVGGNYDGINQL